MTHERDARTPGKSSGVTAEDLVAAPDVGSVAPGRINLVQSREVGDPYIDHGAVCEGKGDSTAGCFLTDRQRDRLIGKFQLRCVTAATNYKIALTDIRVDELVKKDDDLNWVLSLALDLAGAHLVNVVAKALKTLNSTTIKRLTEVELDAGRHGTYDPSSTSRAMSLLERISDKGIEDKTKVGFDVAKTQAKRGLKEALNAGPNAEKAMALSFIDQLKDGCDEGFNAFADHASSSANDAELVVLWEGMDASNHTPGKYKAVLEAKLARFKKSGVADIGRKETLDREFKVASVHRDTRVVWVRDFPGDAKKLYYQSQEGDYNPSVIEPGDPGVEGLDWFNPPGPQKFGARHPRETPKLDRLVPEEFMESAIARNEVVYGPVITLDPVRDWYRSQGVDPATIERASGAPSAASPRATSPLYSAPSIFAQPPGRPYPSGSIFFDQGEKGPSQTDPLVWSDPSSIFTRGQK